MNLSIMPPQLCCLIFPDLMYPQSCREAEISDTSEIANDIAGILGLKAFVFATL
jgi:hypothetical protein